MKFGHGRDQAQEQEQKAGREAGKLALKGVLEGATRLEDTGKELRERLERTLVERRAAQDAFEGARPDGAARSSEQAQERAREQLHAREWQAQIQQVQASVAEAIKAVSHAVASIATRQQAAEQLLGNELTRKAATARDADLNMGLSADELMGRQRGRDEVADRQLAGLAKHDFADIARLEALEKDIRAGVSSLVQSQAELAQRTDRSHGERIAAAREQLERFEESWRTSLAMTLLFDGCFSDIEAVQRTWEQAAAGQTNDAKGFANARQNFWELVNAQQSREATETHRLLSLAKVEWGQGSLAPLLDMQSESIDRVREAAEHGDAQAQRWSRDMDRNTRLSIDHVADKSTHPSLTLLAGNLRFTTQADNSARGASYGVNDLVKADFKRTEAEQSRNAESRDTRRGKTADRSLDELQAKEHLLAPERLRHEQERAQTAHQKDLLATKNTHDLKLVELREGSLRQLDGESEASRLARHEKLLDVLERFQQSGREQLEALNTYQLGAHERQQQDLREALEARNAGSTRKEATDQLVDITKRLTEEHRALEGLWKAAIEQQNQNDGLLLQAIYAKTREAQDEHLRQALAEQEKTRALLQARLDELKQHERMDD